MEVAYDPPRFDISYNVNQADLYEQLKHFPGPKINSKLFGNLDILQKMAINQESVSKGTFFYRFLLISKIKNIFILFRNLLQAN